MRLFIWFNNIRQKYCKAFIICSKKKAQIIPNRVFKNEIRACVIMK